MAVVLLPAAFGIPRSNKFGEPSRHVDAAPTALQASIGACRVPGGDPLAFIINTHQNLGDTHTRGADLQFNRQSGATSSGTFSATVRGTNVTD